MSLRQRIKSAMWLFVVLGGILIGNLWEKDNISELNESFSSIYEDRLLPATYIFHLTDRLYKKRLALEEALAHTGNKPLDELEGELMAHNSSIDTLLSNFKETYLVKEESESLNRFITAYQDYNQEESAILLMMRNGREQEVDLTHLLSEFAMTKTELTKLSQIQTTVGKDLTNGSKLLSANVNLITTFEIALVVIVCFIIEFLVLRVREVPPNPKKFRLN